MQLGAQSASSLLLVGTHALRACEGVVWCWRLRISKATVQQPDQMHVPSGRLAWRHALGRNKQCVRLSCRLFAVVSAAMQLIDRTQSASNSWLNAICACEVVVRRVHDAYQACRRSRCAQAALEVC